MKRVTMLALASVLAGCANHITSVRSSWHVMEEQGASVTYISILNQGNVPIHAKELILNPLRERLFSNAYHSAWHLTLSPSWTLEPGRIFYIRADRFTNGAVSFGPCMIPIELNVRLDGRRSLLVSQLDVAMPNTVPIHWEADCGNAFR